MSLSANGLVCRLRGRTLIDRVGLQVEAGQLHCIVGPNGAGKSTLLSLLSGERAADSGSLHYNGRALNSLSLAERARVRAALPQRDLLDFAFSAEDVVRLGRMPSRPQSASDEAQIVEQAMRSTEVWPLRGRAYTALSGGERARVQLARVLAQIWMPEPGAARILLLDEPTASLDMAHQHRCLLTLRTFAASGVAVVIVVHDLNLAMGYADQVSLLDAGRVLASGAPRDVLTAQNLEPVYGIGVQIVAAGEGRPPIIATRL